MSTFRHDIRPGARFEIEGVTVELEKKSGQIARLKFVVPEGRKVQLHSVAGGVADTTLLEAERD